MELASECLVVALVLWILYREYAAPRQAALALKEITTHDASQGGVTSPGVRDGENRPSENETSQTSAQAATEVDQRLLEGDDIASDGHNEGQHIRIEAVNEANDPTERENVGQKPTLLAATKTGDLKNVLELLKNEDEDVDVCEREGPHQGCTVLMIAAANDDAKIVRQLLLRGANVEATAPRDRVTALHLASELSIVEMLLQNEADTSARDHNGNTPLHLAVWHGQQGKVAMLLENGAAVDAENASNHKPIHMLLQRTNGARWMEGDVAAFHNIAQSLVRRGAVWDGTCDMLINTEDNISLGFSVAIRKWIDERTCRVELTGIPEEMIVRGLRSMEPYIAGSDASNKTYLRRNVCVVGPSFCGKTSLVKSIAKGEPSIERSDPGEIGIERYAMLFSDRVFSNEECLIEACHVGNIEAVRWLVANGADVNARDSKGNTTLHYSSCPHIIRALLGAGASLHARNKIGETVFHKLVKSVVVQSTTTTSPGRLPILQAAAQALVSAGARWDGKCDFIVNGAGEIAQAFREAVHLWTTQQAQGSQLTTFSSETYAQGPRGIREFPAVDGDEPYPAFADRTDDISVKKINAFRHHQLTFWDCGGEEAQQVAHCAFFAKQSLYLVCVDLRAYAVALEQASIRANSNHDIERFMDEFVDSKVLRWVRLILYRQVKPEIVFVGTKKDTIQRTPVRFVNIRVDLEKRVREFAGTIKSDDQHDQQANLIKFQWLTVSCKDRILLVKTKGAIEKVIAESTGSFPMPKLFSQVVDAITYRGSQLSTRDPPDQVSETFLTIPVLSLILRTEIPTQRKALSDEACRGILLKLNEIGDVFWYKDLGIDFLEERLILYPFLLIEFVRRVVHGNQDDEVMRHAKLKESAYWKDLTQLGVERTLAMKRLLQKLQLVHPIGGTMKFDSDLIVPAFWRSKESALWLFLGNFLKNEPGLSRIQNDICVQWEYHFPTALPDTIFDELIVESYLTEYKRHTGPDWILYRVADEFACRVVVTRTYNSFERVLRVEAVAGISVPGTTWGRFKHLCESLEKVLRRCEGLVVSRFVYDGKELVELDAFIQARMRTQSDRHETIQWLPPSMEWYSDCRKTGVGVETNVASAG